MSYVLPAYLTGYTIAVIATAVLIGSTSDVKVRDLPYIILLPLTWPVVAAWLLVAAFWDGLNWRRK